MLRIYIIAPGLTGLYALIAPAVQPELFSLVAGVLFMTMAVSGTKETRQIAGRTSFLTPIFYPLPAPQITG